MFQRFIVESGVPLSGTVAMPGDKSISHRAVLFSALSKETSHIDNWLAAGDTEASLAAIESLGIKVERHHKNKLTIIGGSLQSCSSAINLRHAGTGIRLLSGILAGQKFSSILDGSEQLRARPMKRIVTPLQMMGAKIGATKGCAPLTIEPSSLKGIRYSMPVASAQVKSAVLLAGLFAKGNTTVVEPGPARDHTECMLRAMGAEVITNDNEITLTPTTELKGLSLHVPGDFSSAAFPIVAATIVPESRVILTGVNINPRRTGLLDVLKDMGANIEVKITEKQAEEAVAEITIAFSELKGIEVDPHLVVRMIDEFPIFMLAALCAKGKTTVTGAKELRVKETDRLAVMTQELSKMGAHIDETPDGFSIVGPQKLQSTKVEGHDDHRIAMSLAVAGLIAKGKTVVEDAHCSEDSFPDYAQTMAKLKANIGIE